MLNGLAETIQARGQRIVRGQRITITEAIQNARHVNHPIAAHDPKTVLFWKRHKRIVAAPAAIDSILIKSILIVNPDELKH